MHQRTFTIESVKKANGGRVNYTGGRFVSDTPVAAAKKAFTKAYHYLNKKGPLSLVITIRETTQGSHKKEYTYRIKRVAEKKEVERDGETIVYNFTTRAKAL